MEVSSPNPKYSIKWQCFVIGSNESCFTVKDPWENFPSTIQDQDSFLEKIAHILHVILQSFFGWIENHSEWNLYNSSNKRIGDVFILDYVDKIFYSDNFQKFLLELSNKIIILSKDLSQFIKEHPTISENLFARSNGYVQTISFPARLLKSDISKFLFQVSTKYQNETSEDTQLIVIRQTPTHK